VGNAALENLIARVKAYSQGLEPLRDEFYDCDDEKLWALIGQASLDVNSDEDQPAINKLAIDARKFAEEKFPDGPIAHEWVSLMRSIFRLLNGLNDEGRIEMFEREKSSILKALKDGPILRVSETTRIDTESRQFCETIAAELEQVKSVEPQAAASR
jgi:hypothetical protein